MEKKQTKYQKNTCVFCVREKKLPVDKIYILFFSGSKLIKIQFLYVRHFQTTFQNRGVAGRAFGSWSLKSLKKFNSKKYFGTLSPENY